MRFSKTITSYSLLIASVLFASQANADHGGFGLYVNGGYGPNNIYDSAYYGRQNYYPQNSYPQAYPSRGNYYGNHRHGYNAGYNSYNYDSYRPGCDRDRGVRFIPPARYGTTITEQRCWGSDCYRQDYYQGGSGWGW